MRNIKRLGFAFALSAISFAAQAAPVTFFGEDLNPGGDPNTLSSFPNSTAARTSFFNNLVGVGTETFNGIAVGTTSPTVSFGSVQATLNNGTVSSGSDGAGRYPISSPNYLFAGTADFTVTFNQPIAAFGFFGTDVGDFGGTLTLMLTDALNVVTTLTVPNQLGSCVTTPCSDPTTGSALYFGFFDTGKTYKSIAFTNNSAVDNFGFDDFSVGTLEQVTPSAVPLPGALPLFATGLGVLGLLGWRRKRKAQAAA